MRAARRHHHPRLQQPRLVVACNVSADPPPDVNWQKGTVQYSTVQYSTVQYSTLQYSTVQYQDSGDGRQDHIRHLEQSADKCRGYY